MDLETAGLNKLDFQVVICDSWMAIRLATAVPVHAEAYVASSTEGTVHNRKPIPEIFTDPSCDGFGNSKAGKGEQKP